MDDNEDGEWEETWSARQTAISELLGPVADHVFHAMVPFYLGGTADVMMFPEHNGGLAYVTADLTGGSGQPGNAFWDEYELVICLRSHEDWGANLISRLASYTLESTVDPGETMDIGPALPEPTTLSAFLFAEYGTFHLHDKRCGLLLCVGITPDELEACMAGKGDQVVARLKTKGIFPFTDLRRASCLAEA